MFSDMDNKTLREYSRSLQYDQTKVKIKFDPIKHCYGGDKGAAEEMPSILDKFISKADEVKALFTRVGGEPQTLLGRDFEINVVLSSSESSVIYLGKNVSTEEYVAIKLYKTQATTTQAIMKEAAIQTLLAQKSKNVPKVHGVMLLLPKNKLPSDAKDLRSEFHNIVTVTEYVSAFDDEERPMKMSLCQLKSLCKRETDKCPVSQQQMLNFFKELVSAVEEFAALKIAHLDLHSDNILIKCRGGSI